MSTHEAFTFRNNVGEKKNKYLRVKRVREGECLRCDFKSLKCYWKEMVSFKFWEGEEDRELAFSKLLKKNREGY